MNRVEDLINSAKTNELLGELLHIKKEEEKKSNVLMWVAITLGAVLAVAGIAYAVYRFFTPDYLEDFDEDFDDDSGSLLSWRTSDEAWTIVHRGNSSWNYCFFFINEHE